MRIMQSRFLRKISILLLFLHLCLITTACSSPSLAFDMEVAGGRLLARKDAEVAVWAYRPYVALDLEWLEGKVNGTASISIENINPEITAVQIIPAPGKKPASYNVIANTSTSLTILLEGGSGPQRVELKPTSEKAASGFTIAAIGDSQGRNEVLACLIEEINNSAADFVIHLGDMVPSGSKEEYQAFQETMAALECPWYTVPGNHDVKGQDREYYSSRFGPLNYYFDYGGYRFIFLDTSSLDIDREQLSWFEDTLALTDIPSFVFFHVPPFDPRGKDHCFQDLSMAREFLEMVTAPESPVKVVFSGHVHMFSQMQKDGVTFITSGGGGAPLYAAPNAGGFHHFTLVEVIHSVIKIKACQLEGLPEHSTDIVVSGRDDDIVVSLSSERAIAEIEGESSYQNQLGNYTGQGLYRGVAVRDLLALTGGMKKDDTLIVHSLDGYSQSFAYENVYPETCGWEEKQGEMILATSFNNIRVPQWQDGYRIAFLSADGIYDNNDCEQTSAVGQGWHTYQSAGARWVKNVVRLEVVACETQ